MKLFYQTDKTVVAPALLCYTLRVVLYYTGIELYAESKLCLEPYSESQLEM